MLQTESGTRFIVTHSELGHLRCPFGLVSKHWIVFRVISVEKITELCSFYKMKVKECTFCSINAIIPISGKMSFVPINRLVRTVGKSHGRRWHNVLGSTQIKLFVFARTLFHLRTIEVFLQSAANP